MGRLVGRLVGPDEIVLHDLGSKNGTHVDGARIERISLGEAHSVKLLRVDWK